MICCLTMLERDDINGVICLRGGYGASRTLNTLNTAAGRDRLHRLAGRAPKPFIGFSDITMIHALLARGNRLGQFLRPGADVVREADRIHPGRLPPGAAGSGPVRHACPDPDDPYVETLVSGVPPRPNWLVAVCNWSSR